MDNTPLDQNPPHLCQRCGYAWHSRATGYTHTPKQCPACKSYRWDVPLKIHAPEIKIERPENSLDTGSQENYK